MSSKLLCTPASSSDGSFAWTDASSDSFQSDMKVTHINNDSERDESDSEKKFKQKIQQQLFGKEKSQESAEEQTIDKKRKRQSSEHTSSGEDRESPKKKKIKTEPESDVDGKHNQRHRHSNNVHQDTDSSPTKKNKKKKNRISLEDNEKYSQYVKQEDEGDTRKLKKKAKSRERCSDNETGYNIKDDAFSAEETVVNGKTRLHSEHQSDGETPESQEEAVVKHKVSRRSAESPRKKNKTEVNQTTNDTLADISLSEISLSRIDTTLNESHNVSSHRSKTKRKISERIEFEDDAENESSRVVDNNCMPTMLKQFIKQNANLDMFVPEYQHGPNITENDELWIIRCPRSIDVTAFSDKDLVLETKCKIKLDGQTYEGSVDTRGADLCIVNSKNKHLVINKFPVSGCVALHKRIPKLHIQEVTAVERNQLHFIPLPDTKCRHPLFGPNYKKAIKLPSSVKARLKPDQGSTQPEVNKSKKLHKKEITHNSKNSPNMEDSGEPSVDSGVHSDQVDRACNGVHREDSTSKKKKRKRKHSDKDQQLPLAKKMKQSLDLESAEVWESEKAIEENLFNF